MGFLGKKYTIFNDFTNSYIITHWLVNTIIMKVEESERSKILVCVEVPMPSPCIFLFYNCLIILYHFFRICSHIQTKP